jgi:hypothetical protein
MFEDTGYVCDCYDFVYECLSLAFVTSLRARSIFFHDSEKFARPDFVVIHLLALGIFNQYLTIYVQYLGPYFIDQGGDPGIIILGHQRKEEASVHTYPIKNPLTG